MPADRYSPAPPTPLARRFVKLVLGFGVGIAVGLAPFLGKLQIPGFDALLTLYPNDLRPSLIPLAAFLMGFIAVGVQFLHGERLRRAYLRVAFLVAFAVVFVGFVWLLAIYDERVLRITVPATGESYTFVIAPERRRAACPCDADWSDKECISEKTDPARVEKCWDGRALRRSRKVLRGGYLLLTGGFGAVIGLLLLQERPARRRSAVPGARKRREKSSG